MWRTLPHYPDFPGDKAENTQSDSNPGGAIHKIGWLLLFAGAALRDGIRSGDWIEAAPSPRLTAQEPLTAEPDPPEETMRLDRLE